MFNRILIALGIRKKVVPDTLARRSTDKVRRNTEYGRISTQVPPKAPPTRNYPASCERKQLVFPHPISDYVGVTPDVDVPSRNPSSYIGDSRDIQAKGGEFSGAGASGSWDSPSSSSSDTSSSSSDSGSSSSGSEG